MYFSTTSAYPKYHNFWIWIYLIIWSLHDDFYKIKNAFPPSFPYFLNDSNCSQIFIYKMWKTHWQTNLSQTFFQSFNLNPVYMFLEYPTLITVHQFITNVCFFFVFFLSFLRFFAFTAAAIKTSTMMDHLEGFHSSISQAKSNQYNFFYFLVTDKQNTNLNFCLLRFSFCPLFVTCVWSLTEG